jgi:hypothetical protein
MSERSQPQKAFCSNAAAQDSFFSFFGAFLLYLRLSEVSLVLVEPTETK